MGLTFKARRQRAERWFGLRFVVGTLVGLGCLAAFNIVMNPFGVWPDPLGRPINRRLTARINTVRISKAYDLWRPAGRRQGTTPPDALITGLSTVAWGIDPQTTPVANEVLYNAGLPGSSLEEQYHYLQRWLVQAPSVRKVYVDLKIAGFNAMSHLTVDFRFDRLTQTIPPLSDLAFLCLTRHALSSSLNAWRVERTQRVAHMFHDTGDGYHHVPEATYPVYLANFKRMMRTQRPPLLHSKRVDPVQLLFLQRMVKLCEERGVELVLFFSPEHAWLQEQECFASGFEQEVYQLRREVARIHPYWDFTLCGTIIAEPASRIEYFIDQTHYHSRAGRLVLAAMNGQRPEGLSPAFGVYVTKDNVEEHIDRMQRGLEQWREDRLDEATYVREFVTPSLLPLPVPKSVPK